MSNKEKRQIAKDLERVLGKIVVKQYTGKEGYVITKFPDMSTVTYSDAQLKERARMAEAVAFAKMVKDDPDAIASFKRNSGGFSSLYHAALSHYLKSVNR